MLPHTGGNWRRNVDIEQDWSAYNSHITVIECPIDAKGNVGHFQSSEQHADGCSMEYF